MCADYDSGYIKAWSSGGCAGTVINELNVTERRGEQFKSARVEGVQTIEYVLHGDSISAEYYPVDPEGEALNIFGPRIGCWICPSPGDGTIEIDTHA